MGFIYGLAVVLVIFEGIIIYSEGAGLKVNKVLPEELTEKICSYFDFPTLKNVIASGILTATDYTMSEILQNRIILIKPLEFDGEIHEYYENGDLYVRFGVYKQLILFFEKFGDKVKKIEYWYDPTIDNVQHNEIIKEINEKIIKRCAKTLDELRITTPDDSSFWDDISNGENGIIFPEVKKFEFDGESWKERFNLNVIFPKLESFALDGNVADRRFLRNVTDLKEIMLDSEEIDEYQLEYIIENNKKMTKITICYCRATEILKWIAEHLKELKTLKLLCPYREFLIRADENEACVLSSVINLEITRYIMSGEDFHGNLTFDMPNLKKLTFKCDRITQLTDDQIVNMIKHFNGLETVEILARGYSAVKCIGQLQYIKEFMTTIYENDFEDLKSVFQNFDINSELQTLKLVYFNESFYKTYENELKQINIDLKESGKPTWTLSHGEQFGINLKHIMKLAIIEDEIPAKNQWPFFPQCLTLTCQKKSKLIK
uniref:Secreted protein A n=1 Tax=Mayetiola destructor TaxID=39758 RepID=D1MLN0_MAYDE|nr:secreted protein A [Mayetiola destructor]